MPAGEFQIVVRRSLTDLEKEMRTKYKLGDHLLDSAFVEEGSLVFVFGEGRSPAAAGSSSKSVRRLRSRRRGRRNRTRTRGWKPISSFMNSLGQKVRVYDVFVNALKESTQTKAEQRAIVAELMKANGNTPAREQVDYFLDNTLEYLKKPGARGGVT